ncbi:Exocyst complex component SEC15 [Rhodotorula toruloides]|uniref:Exocyst complex component SEC15 n=1 Tax=Rhodotorula toruloides TaxID=5286 RepID=A0A0K3CED1_RHOTO|nr:Exocyst complex component SEC15 [Rhodotorula toruloides]PRQ77160.1 Exocyst complex subunit Sec15-like-domain containing protein [Rhodotorula toruloides]
MSQPRTRRVKFSQQEIQSQLQQLFLFSSLSSSATGDIEALSPILVNIHRSRQQDAYLRALKAFVAEKEKEIEAVCGRNYQDFVGSVSALLRVRQGTVSLKHRVVELNDDVQKSGAGLADKKKALLDARRVGQNIDETIDTLQACLRVLDMASKVQNLIQNAKYFSALRQLEDLQATHLKPVLHYPFATLMLSSVPDLRNSIRDAVTRSLKAWMYEARETSRSVGKGALDAMEQRGRRWAARKRKDASLGLAKINGPIELGLSERHEYNVLDNDAVKIDFKPLYTCIHIYDTLDAREELQLSYQADRRAQAGLLLSSTSSLNPFSLPALSTLLEEIVGFFLIESHVLRTTNSFRSEQDVEDLWNGMCERVVKIVDEGLAGCEEAEVFLGTKFKVLTFVQTLEGYGYSVSHLNSLLLTLFERYSQLLQRTFSADFEKIVVDDDHQPMVINDEEEFGKVVSVTWLPSSGEWSAEQLKSSGFPLALPFSQTYPLCCVDIRSFTEQYYQFAEGFAEHHRDIDDVLRKALDNLLIKQVSENIQRRLNMISNLSQLAQIVVNVLFFQTACSDLETLLVTLRATQRGGTIHLDSLASFQQTLTQTQDRMVAQISQKVDTFFEEAQYPWTATQPPPPHTANDASGYLQDLIDYVSTVMMSVLIQLPEFAKDYVYRGALARCATVLQSYLTDKEPRQISDAGLLHLARDVRWLVNHVKTLGNDRLADVFTELNQLVTLLTATPNITDYLDPQARSTRFHRVQPRALQTVLIKLLTFYNSPQGSGVGHRRRQQVEDTLRALAR